MIQRALPILYLLLFFDIIKAQTVLPVGPAQTYPTIAAAYAAIPATITGPYIIELQAGYNSLAESFPIDLNARNGTSAINTITIRPAVTGRTIASADLDATIKLDGARFVVIDGRVNGVGANDLTITNSNVLGNAIEFTNGAFRNTCINTEIVGVSDSGVIFFNGRGNANGVDSNAVRNCDLSGYSGVPARLVTMQSAQNIYNDANEVSGCTFQYFLGRNSNNNICFSVYSFQRNFLIRGNSFFEPDSLFLSIENPSNDVIYCDAYRSNGTIDSNYFGGTAALCTGGPMKVGSYPAAYYTNQLAFIDFGNSSLTIGGTFNVGYNTIKNMQINANVTGILNDGTGNQNKIIAYNNVIGDANGIDSTNFSGTSFAGFSLDGDTANYLNNNIITNTRCVYSYEIDLFVGGIMNGNQVGGVSPYGYTFSSAPTIYFYRGEKSISNGFIYNSFATGDTAVYVYQADTVSNNYVQNLVASNQLWCVTPCQKYTHYNISNISGNVFNGVTSDKFTGIYLLNGNTSITPSPMTVQGNRFYNVRYVSFTGINATQNAALKAPYMNISNNLFQNISPDTVYNKGLALLPFYGIYSNLDFINMTIAGNVIDSVVHNTNLDYEQASNYISGIYLVASNNNATLYDTSTITCNTISHFSFKGGANNSNYERLFFGIYHTRTGMTLNVSNNEVSHISEAGSKVGAKLTGIYLEKSRANFFLNYNVDGNMIHDMYVNDSVNSETGGALPTGARILAGIITTSATIRGTTNVASVSYNKIYNLGYLGNNTNTQWGWSYEVEGIDLSATDTITKCNHNWISNIQSHAHAPGSMINGIRYIAGNFSDNIIALGQDENGNDIDSAIAVYGMVNLDTGYAFTKLLFNTIYLSGNVTTDAHSDCVFDTASQINPGSEFFVILNNVFANNRYNAAYPNNHLCFNLPTVINTTMDLNDYYKSGRTGLGSFNQGQTIANTLTNIKSAIIGQNSGAISTDPLLVNSLGIYDSLNFAPQNGSPLIQAGFYLSAVKNDYFGVNRHPIPTIGAVESAGFVDPVITAQDVPCIANSSTGSILISQTAPLNWTSYKVYETAIIKSGNISTSPYTVSGLGVGSYTLVLYALNGDSLSQPVMVCLSAEPTLNYTDSISGGCGSQGRVVITATGGTAPYTYSGFGTSNTGGVFQNLAPGNYPVSITSAEGCRVETSITIAGGSLTAIADTVLPNKSCTQPNGFVSVTATTGTKPFSYNLSGQINATGDFGSLAAGTYTVNVNDSTGCSVAVNVTVPDSTPALTVTILPVSATICNGDSATLTATGGTNYNWNNSLGAGASKTVAPASTITYSVTVTDNNNCSGTASKTVSVNQLPAASILPATVAVCMGDSATLTASGGASYSWSNGLGAGVSKTVSPTNTITYIVTVTDNNNCSATASKTVTVNQLPAAGISPSSVAVCMGDSATLTASGGVSYSWSNSLGNGASKTVAPTSTIAYSVTVTDNNSCSATASKTVSVNQLPVAGILPATLTICKDDSATLTASGGTTYNWSNSLGTGVSKTVSPSNTITYIVTASDDNNCSATASTTVSVNQLPVPGISPATAAVCLGDSTTLTANGGTSYSWSNSLGNGAAITVSPSNTITYIVTVTDNNNCSATASKTVTVNQLPNATISGLSTVCSGLTDTLTANGGTAYNWNNGLGNSAQIIVIPTSTTTYSVTVTDANSCSATAAQTVSISTSPAANISGASQICAGATTALIATGGGTYAWANGLGNNDTITISPLNTTIYTVTVSLGGNCSASVSQTVEVFQPAASQFSQNICNGSSYTFNGMQLSSAGAYNDTLQTLHGCDSIVTLNLAVTTINDTTTVTGALCTAAQAGATYLWLDCKSGQSIPAATAQTYTATQTGNYACIVSIDNCTDTTNCVTAVVNGIANIESYSFDLYPNPNQGSFIITYNYPNTLHLRIANSIGSLVTDYMPVASGAQLDLSKFAAGVYQVMILDDNQLLKVIKVVKQ